MDGSTGHQVEKQAIMTIKKVGVIGAGQMGNGIAHVSALNGYDVILNDVNEEAIDKALETIRGNLDRQLRRGIIADSDIDAALSRIKPSTDLEPLNDFMLKRFRDVKDRLDADIEQPGDLNELPNSEE